MTQKEFWEHIEKTKRKDPETHQERLVARLAKLPVKEILDFGRLWWAYRCEAYSWQLWGAAYIIGGGCSDDGFDYFRNWLVLQGKTVFRAALKNPDSLAKIVTKDDFTEVEGEPAADAWFMATGKERTDAACQELWDAERAHRGALQPLPSLGRGWDFDSDKQMRKRYPRLWALYMEGETGE